MLGTVAAPTIAAAGLRRQNHQSWWYGYGVCLCVTVVVAALALYTAPRPFSLALVVVLAGIVACVARPRFGIYLVALLGILGDGSTSPWYPFVKNLSSPESILFINRQLIISPLELFIAALVVGWVLQMLSTRRWVLVRGQLFRPLMVFVGFLLLGLATGLARGGNSTAALSEIRGILYLPVLYVLVTNLFDRPRQYQRLFWCVLVAIAANGVVAMFHERSLAPVDELNPASLVDHGATLGMNAMFIFILAAWFFRGASPVKRWLLPLVVPPVVFAYIVSERRAAFVALVAALIVLCVVLYGTDRRRFWSFAPALLVFGTLYVGAFWSTTSGLGYPAQAVKSVVAPDQLDDRDQSSDLYRVLENYDIVYTIRSSPVTGIGFGQPFLQPYPLPGITAFALNAYVTHNSVLWIWMKAGIGGFVAMLYLFGVTLRRGARAILTSSDSDQRVLTVTSVAFVVMYAVFAYVDIGWDPRNMILLAIAMAQIDSVHLFSRQAHPVVAEPPREARRALTLRIVGRRR